MTARRDWQLQAACKDHPDPEIWYPEPEDADDREQQVEALRRRDEAVRICRQCPVRQACLRQALAAGERFGIWGGLTPVQRERLIRRGSKEAAA